MESLFQLVLKDIDFKRCCQLVWWRPFSAVLQLCPEAFRVRAPPPSALTSSLRTRATKTSCRTRSPWSQRRRTRTAKTSKLLIGQDLGNPASQTLTVIKPLSWAQDISALRGLPCPSVQSSSSQHACTFFLLMVQSWRWKSEMKALWLSSLIKESSSKGRWN